jgi:hypothetical protein
MIGKKQLKPWDIRAYWLTLAGETGSTNMITVNCTIAIIEPLSAVMNAK